MVEKIIHQIWFGNPPSEETLRRMQTIRVYNPNWEYKLWGESDIPNHFKSKNMKRITCRSDVLRVEIMKTIGGVYFDTDIECYGPIDDIVKDRIIFASFENGNFSPSCLGSQYINHPAFDQYLQEIDIETIEKPYNNPVLWSGDLFMRKIFTRYADFSGIPNNDVFIHHKERSWVKLEREERNSARAK